MPKYGIWVKREKESQFSSPEGWMRSCAFGPDGKNILPAVYTSLEEAQKAAEGLQRHVDPRRMTYTAKEM